MIVQSDKSKLIISKSSKIYKPKPKRVYKFKPKFSILDLPKFNRHIIKDENIGSKFDLNLKKAKSANYNINQITNEEMEKDFKKLNHKRKIKQIIKEEKELVKLLENSTNDNSDEDTQKKKKNKNIKRPKNIKYFLYKDKLDEFEMEKIQNFCLLNKFIKRNKI